jgi:hypothetical protein
MVDVLCDYCPAVATHFIQRGPPEHRSFACEEHYQRALYSFDPRRGFIDPPVNDQPEKRLWVDDAEAVWRKSAKRVLKAAERAAKAGTK